MSLRRDFARLRPHGQDAAPRQGSERYLDFQLIQPLTDDVILVTDDFAPNRDMVKTFLSRKGFRVVTAESGMEAIRVTEREPISLVLMDLMMPEMSGIQALEQLRLRFNSTELPVLIVSAKDDSPQMVEAIDKGANDYLTKPFDLPVLLAKIKRHLAVRSEQQRHMHPLPPREGALLGRYRIGEKLGQGGMGHVHRAFDTELQRDIALKLMQQHSPEARERFLLEGRAVARISHPRIVTIYEIGWEPQPYLAMELLEGRLLEEILDERSLTLKQALRWTLQILEALQVCHDQEVVHRDLKPANLMIQPDGSIKLMDFGLAKLVDESSRLTQSGQAFGTPQYMAPEQVNPDFGEIGPATDLYALGAIFYEMLVGSSPFGLGSPGQLIMQLMTQTPVPPVDVNPLLSPELSDFCMRALAKRTHERYPSAEAMSAELCRIIDTLEPAPESSEAGPIP